MALSTWGMPGELGFARVILWSLACSRGLNGACCYTSVMQNSSTHHTGAPETRRSRSLCVRCSGTHAIRRSCSRALHMGWNSALAVGGFTFERIDLLITLLAAAVTPHGVAPLLPCACAMCC